MTTMAVTLKQDSWELMELECYVIVISPAAERGCHNSLLLSPTRNGLMNFKSKITELGNLRSGCKGRKPIPTMVVELCVGKGKLESTVVMIGERTYDSMMAKLRSVGNKRLRAPSKTTS
jgi:hypothetical protein